MERAILQSEFIRADELEHELGHREKMLSMLRFAKDSQVTDVNVPPYSSCPALKVDPSQFYMRQKQ